MAAVSPGLTAHFSSTSQKASIHFPSMRSENMSALFREADQQPGAQSVEAGVERQSENGNRDDRHKHVHGLKTARRPHQQMAEPVSRRNHLGQEHHNTRDDESDAAS